MDRNKYLIGFNEKENSPSLPIGFKYLCAQYSIQSINAVFNSIKESNAILFFWDFSAGDPDYSIVQDYQDRKAELWYGCQVAVENRILLDYVRPCHMLSAEPFNLKRPFTSWKISFRQLIIEKDIITTVGELCESFKTMEGASLDFGIRALGSGVLTRHHGFGKDYKDSFYLNQTDNQLLLKRNTSIVWYSWSIMRSVFTGALRISEIKPRISQQKRAVIVNLGMIPNGSQSNKWNVSVIIITMNRYKYLNSVLKAIDDQTISPTEVIIVDNTPEKFRDLDFPNSFKKANYHFFYPDLSEVNGQCSARNFGIRQAKGDAILFLDDDVERVPYDLIETHIGNLSYADSSSGVHEELGVPKQNYYGPKVRVADVFPTTNSMVKKSTLLKTNLFDVKMDRGQNEDHELGLQMFRSGALMVLDSRINLLHLKAPIGGLRSHKSRVITQNASRQNIVKFRLLHRTEIYTNMKHFPDWMAKERIMINILSTFAFKGPIYLNILKILFALMLLPFHTSILLSRRAWAKKMLSTQYD